MPFLCNARSHTRTAELGRPGERAKRQDRFASCDGFLTIYCSGFATRTAGDSRLDTSRISPNRNPPSGDGGGTPDRDAMVGAQRRHTLAGPAIAVASEKLVAVQNARNE